MDPRGQLAAVLYHVLGAQGLVGEAHVHDAGRMPLGRRQVYQPPLCQQMNPAAIPEGVLFYEAPQVPLAYGVLVEGGNVDLYVEMSAVGQESPIFHRIYVDPIDGVQAAGGRYEDVAHL